MQVADPWVLSRYRLVSELWCRLCAMPSRTISYKRHRFPPEIIAHAVWLYVRFNLSLRSVEELRLERGIDVSYETLRRWVAKFGPLIARNLPSKRARPGDIWHLDEVRVSIRGDVYWLWRAVDQDGTVLDEILQRRRSKKAAKRLLKQLLKNSMCPPKRIVTDRLRSYGAAKSEIAPGLDHRKHKGLNNRADNSHLPFRTRERAMRGHRSHGGLQRFVSMHSRTRNLFVPPRRRATALQIRDHRLEAFDIWKHAASLT